jgi:hypothetical protein
MAMKRVATASALSVAVLLMSATFGCGDDGGDAKGETTAGTGGSSSGGNKAAGGSGGKSSGGDGAYSGDECVTTAQTNAQGFSEACLTCACKENATAVGGCDAACWALMGCAAAKCADVPDSEAQACAQTMCTAEIGASVASGSVSAVIPLSMLMRGATCGASCMP